MWLRVCVWACMYVLGESMCTYPPHCFYCYQTSHLFWDTDCALCAFEGSCSYRVWLHFLPLFHSPLSCFSSVTSLLSNSGFCLVFMRGGVVERLVLCRQQRRPPNTITGCFGALHFTRSEGVDPSQLRAGRTGCCPSPCDPPSSSLWSLARYTKPEPEHFTQPVQAVDNRVCPIITIWFQHF